MNDEASAQARLILRADVKHATGTVVTHTLEVGVDSVRVAAPAIVAEGDVVQIVLSFPGLIETFELVGRATASHAGDGHGRPASVTFAVEEASDAARSTLGRIATLNGQSPPPPSATQATKETTTYRCLLVEDNAFIRDLFSYALDKYVRSGETRVSLELAEDAETAWAMLKEAGYDIAIIDHYLPMQNGAELIARLRAEPRLTNLAVVAISVGGAEARDASMAAGADLFLDKPVVMRDLFMTLDQLALRPLR